MSDEEKEPKITEVEEEEDKRSVVEDTELKAIFEEISVTEDGQAVISFESRDKRMFHDSRSLSHQLANLVTKTVAMLDKRHGYTSVKPIAARLRDLDENHAATLLTAIKTQLAVERKSRPASEYSMLSYRGAWYCPQTNSHLVVGIFPIDVKIVWNETLKDYELERPARNERYRGRTKLMAANFDPWQTYCDFWEMRFGVTTAYEKMLNDPSLKSSDFVYRMQMGRYTVKAFSQTSSVCATHASDNLNLTLANRRIDTVRGADCFDQADKRLRYLVRKVWECELSGGETAARPDVISWIRDDGEELEWHMRDSYALKRQLMVRG